MTAEYVDRISKGDIPPKITDTYNGDFNEIKNNLNACIDTMTGAGRNGQADQGDGSRSAGNTRPTPPNLQADGASWSEESTICLTRLSDRSR